MIEMQAACRTRNGGSWRAKRGLASALVIMVLVLLIFFAVLSAVASAADLRLSRKRAAWNQQYYLADSAAVSLYAGLDQLYRGKPEPERGADKLAEAIGAWLEARDDVREYHVAKEDGALRVRILVLDPAGTQPENNDAPADVRQQGIEMTLVIMTGPVSDPSGGMKIESWTQWQMPFEYDTDDSGVWEG